VRKNHDAARVQKIKKSRRCACVKKQEEVECEENVTTLCVCKNQKEGELMKKSGRFACVKIQDEVECGEKVTALRVCKKSMKM
jgi:hypothetical protein